MKNLNEIIDTKKVKDNVQDTAFAVLNTVALGTLVAVTIPLGAVAKLNDKISDLIIK